MRWYLLAAAMIGLSISEVTTFAQRPPADQRLGISQSTPEDAGFFATTGVVRFQLIQGRLCLDAPRHRKGSQSHDVGDVYESITVTAQRGIPSLHYVCQTPDQHLTLSVQGANYVRIESFLPKTGERSILDQPELGVINWQTAHGELSEEHEGATLLHVRQCNSGSFDLHYGRLMGRLLRGKTIRALASATQTRLIQQAELVEGPHSDAIAETVRQLRAPKRAARMQAQQKLIHWGTPIIPVVQSLNPDDLDAEQRERLRHVLSRLKHHVDDTPASMAMLLVNDRHYWNLIAPRLSERQVQLANHHLTRAGLDVVMLQSRPDARIAANND